MSFVRTPLRVLVWSAAIAVFLFSASAYAQSRRADLEEVLRRFPANPPFPTNVAEAKAAMASRSEKIDPALLRIGDEVQSKGIGSLEAKAEDLGVVVQENLVLVTLRAEDEDEVQELADAVEDLGGTVQTTFENLVFAQVPPNAIERLGGVESLAFGAPPGELEAHRQRSAH